MLRNTFNFQNGKKKSLLDGGLQPSGPSPAIARGEWRTFTHDGVRDTVAPGLSACCRTRLLFFVLVCLYFFFFLGLASDKLWPADCARELWRAAARAPLSLNLLPRLKCAAHV